MTTLLSKSLDGVWPELKELEKPGEPEEPEELQRLQELQELQEPLVLQELGEPEDPHVLQVQEKPQELEEPEELQVAEVLARLTEPFVLKLAYPVDSEVDGSEWRRTAARISEHQVQRGSPFSPFWHSLLLLIPCLEAFVPG